MIEVFLAGGPVMYPLLLCSVIALAIIIDRTFFWLKYNHERLPELVSKLCTDARNGQQTSLDGKTPDIISSILLEGLNGTPEMATLRMQQAAAWQEGSLARNQGVLYTMVSLAPLLGIFGTVLGIIESFSLLGDTNLVDPLAASGGLAQALITTAFGLGIAMPSLIAHKVLESKCARFRLELEKHCTELEMSLGISPEI